MPRKRSAQNPKQAPPETLENITNQQITQRKRADRKCVVKMRKLSEETISPVEPPKDLKRRSVVNEKVDSGPPTSKKLSETTTLLPNDQTVENLIRKYAQLQKVISNKYVTVVERLKLDFVPLCAESIEHCHQKHYKKAPPPKSPSAKQLNLIRNSPQQARYKIFISMVWNLCQKKQFPGDLVLTNIVKLILTLNPESKHNAFLQPFLDQLLWLFELILQIFPPCWLAIRPSYMKFLRNTIGMSKLLPDKALQAENTIFEVVLMLLEDTIDPSRNLNGVRQRNPNSSKSLTDFDDEYLNMQHWEKNDDDEHMFSALPQATRLDRLMQVLHLIAKMLEMDLAMWMLRYHKHPTKHIYKDGDQPLVITLFSLSKYTRSSVLVKKVLTLFAVCVEKGLSEYHLKVMERFVSLLANIQNLCDIENTRMGIKYPNVGPATISFTTDLYKASEVNLKKDVNTYLRLIKTLRCPFIRYDFIDRFLKRFNPDAGKMCPQKIFENFRKQRWLECSPDEERSFNNSSSRKQSIVYRQDYLQLLLDALQNYCDLHGTKEFFNELHPNNAEGGTYAESQQEKPTTSCKEEINLLKIKKNILGLESKVDMSLRLRQPRTHIPVVNIRVNSNVLSQYRTDIKYVMNLRGYIQALQSGHNEDFSKLLAFLEDYAAKY